MNYFWSPQNMDDHHHERFETDDLTEDFWLLVGIVAGVWITYSSVLYFADKWTFNILPWYFEVFSIFPVTFYFVLGDQYGKNPANWWPIVCGTKVKCKENSILDDLRLKQLGGPFNVYQPDYETLKFRRKKDAFKYTMFDYRP